MAIINGNGDGTRLVNWLMGIASAVVVVGICALIKLALDNNTSISGIQSQLNQMERNQERRDGEQDKWIDYFRQRLDAGRRGPSRQRAGNEDGD